MQKELTVELKKAHAQCIYLELMLVELPENYEKSIVNTQVRKIKLTRVRREVDLIL